MNCNEMFNAGICYVTDAYKTVCKFNEELHADLEKYRDENARLRELTRESVRFERYGCYGCSREDTCGAQGIYDEECVRRQGIEQSMHELGVEV